MYVALIFCKNFVDCNNAGIDLVFVLDGSGSINSGQYQLLREFAANVASTLTIGPQDSLVGAIVFSSNASIQFNVQQYTSATTLLPALNPGLPYPGGGTNTAAALQLLLSSAQDGAMGLRDGHTHVAIVVTDGRSNDPASTTAAADALHASGIYQVYAAGLGLGALMAAQNELNLIASDCSLVFERRRFDVIRVAQLTNMFTQTICEEQS